MSDLLPDLSGKPDVNLFFLCSLHSGDMVRRAVPLHARASREECQDIAKFLDILSVDSFDVSLIAKSCSGNRVEISGFFQAKITQRCIVTLDPMISVIQEKFKRFCISPDSHTRVRIESEMVLDIFDERDEEPLVMMQSGIVNVKDVILEELSLCINPYPRLEKAIPVKHEPYIFGQEEKFDRKNFFELLKSMRKRE